ncbi:MAG: site-specific DNA-methyltransferase [Chloroflexi bacterium]|nr:MAG: site-specific DNA-methyltransferase [Chloroflexota bacterium]
MTIVILNANSISIPLKDKSVHCVISSPPYWGLRDYGTATWEGGDPECDHRFRDDKRDPTSTLAGTSNKEGFALNHYKAICGKCGAKRIDNQLGLEAVPDCLGWATGDPCGECYVCHMVQVFRECWRVLRDNGTLWLNLGDSFNGSGGPGSQYDNKAGKSFKGEFKKYENPNRKCDGLKPKDMVGIPWRVAFALQADGWYLRMDNIWSKPNPMPESVTDRPSKSHEYLFLFSKNKKYYYDQVAVLEPVSGGTHARISQNVAEQVGSFRATGGAKTNGPMKAVIRTPKQQPEGLGIKNNESFNNALALPVIQRNKRSVWEITTQPYAGAHFATYPPKLVEPCILAGTSEKGCCPECGAPWERIVERKVVNRDELPEDDPRYRPNRYQDTKQAELRGEFESGKYVSSSTLGWQPACSHDLDPVPCRVLDPFSGSGTTVMVARALGRDGIGLDLSLKYILECAVPRLQLNALDEWETGKKVDTSDLSDLPMFAGVSA